MRFSSTDSWLEFSTEQNYIAPYDSLDFVVTINAADLGPGGHNGFLNYASNDIDNPSGSIPVSVYIYPPHISVDQTAIGDTLESGEQSTIPLLINNDGPGRLSYSINCETFDILLGGRKLIRPLIENTEPLGFRPADPDKSKGDEPYFPPVITGSGGPDMFGYTWIDSDEPGGPAYEWIDISGYGTPVTLDDDDWAGPIPIEFNFPFYENSYSDIYISSNGFFTFGSGHSTITNTNIPNTSEPNNLLSIWWDDLDPSSGGNIYYFYDRDNNVFIISFINVPNYYYGGGTGSLTFQVILYPSGKILFQYEVMDPGSDYYGLEGATVGIENAGGTDGLQVVYNAAYMHDYLAIKFSAARWLSVEPDAGWIEPYSGDTVDVILDAAELEDGEYSGQITISSNDPDNPTLEIPVTLFVGTIHGCDYMPGDINGDDEVTGSDVTYGVLYFKGLGNPPQDSCWDDSSSTWLYAGGDVNGNCRFSGSDVSFLVAYFKGYNPELQYCPRIPPIGPIIAKPGIIKQKGIIQESSGKKKITAPLRVQ
ncbi:MAG: hypothetical protein B6D58_07405 [candidate division Zixibacteria bacterium 4484_95]|nr:MAG: hypothetical protein B6D58_07405 [candidate division Zixibacteria bacterium 4484_95]